ncbi:hypothetical protein I4U23_030592 [Adineta vaga]|nr:hypothetical protein I4U23_030592 [Adineta vaga]
MSDESIKRSISTDSNGVLTNLITRTTIREANHHLEMLYTRNQELEQLLHEQKEEMQQRDFEYNKLFQTHQLLEEYSQQLQALLDDRTQRLYVYERKEVIFQEIIKLKPTIESLLNVLTTFEESDRSSASLPISFNTKPLEFVQAMNRKTSKEFFLSDI